MRVFSEIDSTNNEAKRQLSATSHSPALYVTDHRTTGKSRGKDASSLTPTLYVTDHQTAGRGRHGHEFYSPKGSGLYFTLALPADEDPAAIQLLTCAAAVAVCEVVEALSDKITQIKWVNDIFFNEKKVAGILTELIFDKNNQILSVIVGIGINLKTAHFPAEFAKNAGNIGKVEPNRLCAEISDRLIESYKQLKNENFRKKMIKNYRKRNFVIGKEVEFTDTDGIHTATATDIAADGSLVVEENGIQKMLHSGEISIKPII